MNRDKIRAAYFAALADPERHKQELWVERRECGTVACLGGRAILQEGWAPSFAADGEVLGYTGPAGIWHALDDLSEFDLAAGILGLDNSPAALLFVEADDLRGVAELLLEWGVIDAAEMARGITALDRILAEQARKEQA